MNLIVSRQSTESSSGQPCRQRLRNLELTSFEPGQPVVWTYRSQVRPHQVYLVAAEVVHGGPFRVRIRLQDTAGNTLLRWVKPERLRSKQVNEASQLYPA